MDKGKKKDKADSVEDKMARAIRLREEVGSELYERNRNLLSRNFDMSGILEELKESERKREEELKERERKKEWEMILSKWDLFTRIFFGKMLSVVMCSSNPRVLLRDVCTKNVVHPEYPMKTEPHKNLVHLDLATVQEDEYKMIVERLTWLSMESGGVLFDNIDKIPDIPNKVDFEYLVQMALKRDTLPTMKGAPVYTLDFNKLSIGAKCDEYPSFLKGKSLLAFTITLDD